MEEPAVESNIGLSVHYVGRTWKIIGINYLKDYDIECWENRKGYKGKPDGLYRIESSCILGLDPDHPHYAYLV